MRSVIFAALLLVAVLPARQARVVLPPRFDNTEAPGNTAYGFGPHVAASHVQWLFDSSCFTSQGTGHPILRTRLRWRANGASTVAVGNYRKATVTAVPLKMGDDTISTAQVLPFTFPWVGGSATSIKVCSLGYVLLLPTTATNGEIVTAALLLLDEQARLALAWADGVIGERVR